MSKKYHRFCTQSADKVNDTRSSPSQKKLKPLTEKPFCDCKKCPRKNCPDVLKEFCISVTEDSCNFSSKIAEDTDSLTTGDHDDCKNDLPKRLPKKDCQNLLDILDKSQNCTCEIISKVVRSNVYINRGKLKTIGVSKENISLDDTVIDKLQ